MLRSSADMGQRNPAALASLPPPVHMYICAYFYSYICNIYHFNLVYAGIIYLLSPTRLILFVVLSIVVREHNCSRTLAPIRHTSSHPLPHLDPYHPPISISGTLTACYPCGCLYPPASLGRINNSLEEKPQEDSRCVNDG